MNTDYVIEIMEGIKEGVTYQTQFPSSLKWVDIPPDTPVHKICSYLAQKLKFRIKPEPMEVWVNVYPDKKVYLHLDEKSAVNGLIGSDTGETKYFKEVV